MPDLLIKCPSTGKDVPTGFTMDRASFEEPTNTIENCSVPCPYCRQVHVWSKADAFFAGDRGRLPDAFFNRN